MYTISVILVAGFPVINRGLQGIDCDLFRPKMTFQPRPAGVRVRPNGLGFMMGFDYNTSSTSPATNNYGGFFRHTGASDWYANPVVVASTRAILPLTQAGLPPYVVALICYYVLYDEVFYLDSTVLGLKDYEREAIEVSHKCHRDRALLRRKADMIREIRFLSDGGLQTKLLQNIFLRYETRNTNGATKTRYKHEEDLWELLQEKRALCPELARRYLLERMGANRLRIEYPSPSKDS